MDKLFLVGMPGSGKSTLGEQVAAHYGLPFFDLDKEVETYADQKITDIFNTEGETTFRRLERMMLHKVTKEHKRLLLATGGGTPCYFDNMDFMNDYGMTLFINVPLEKLMARLRSVDLEQRPKIGNELNLTSYLETTFQERIKVYREAKREIRGENIQATDIIAALEEHI